MRPDRYRPILSLEIDLATPTADIDAARYREIWAFVSHRGAALGRVKLPVLNGLCKGEALRAAALDTLGTALLHTALEAALAEGLSAPGLTGVPRQPARPVAAASPSVTVAVCTRDRTSDLARCLASLEALDPAPAEILVIDNAPASDATASLTASRPRVRYVKEPRPGLDWARNRAILEARGDVIAFTDDDVVVSRGWVGAIARIFAEDPDADAATGLVLPDEIETEAQEIFERYGGFGRGFERRWYRVAPGESAGEWHGGTGKFGTGANMAFRRRLFDEIGHFDPALDVGTATNGGGDLEMFFRVMRTGHTLVYEPDAVVRHRHRRDFSALRDQLANNGIGFYSYLVAASIASSRERWPLARLGARWLWSWNVRRLLISLYKPGVFPIDLITAELQGVFKGLLRYPRAERAARALGDTGDWRRPERRPTPDDAPPAGSPLPSVRIVDVAGPVEGIDGAQAHRTIDVVVLRNDRLLGTVRIDNRHAAISGIRLRQAIVRTLGTALLGDTDVERSRTIAAFGSQFERSAAEPSAVSGRADPAETGLPSQIPVSIVVATRDRPDDLRNLLASLTRLRTGRRVEIIVVDNHPASGQTAPVVAAFPGVRLVPEPRRGLSYARNAGIVASSGDLVVCTDDDVVVPPGWLEALLAPFADGEVMAVTGNVLPADLSSRPERLFEAYGGLGRGVERLSVDDRWFWAFRGAVPTWKLGGTANAAFRASIFEHPRIGLFDEALGAGTPAGCSEDTDLFYRILRAGYRMVYEPRVFVWHRHRRSMEALRRQLFAYAKGHVAAQLMTLGRDGDWRAISRLLVEMPGLYWWRIRERLARRTPYPLSLVAVEMAGYLLGPLALWQSRRRVRRLGRSARYVARGTPATEPRSRSEQPDRIDLIAGGPCATL